MKTIGMYDKFTVIRNDGTSEEGGKHETCQYFVLDLNHDPFALPALRAYASACRAEYPHLADDLDRITSLVVSTTVETIESPKTSETMTEWERGIHYGV